MRFDVLTLFPDIFQSFLGQSILKLAQARDQISVHLWDIRDWAKGKHRCVDDRPFGGGAGMVMMCEPVIDCVEAVRAADPDPGELIMFTPAGERLTQPRVQELATARRLILLCGRYEGFDERIRLILKPREISIGDFVCNGGEVPAMVIIEAVTRLVPGVLGDAESVVDESHSEVGRLEYPQYTRPREFRGLDVPEVLLNGDHAAIARWRASESDARSQRQSETPSINPTGGDGGDEESTHSGN